MTKHTVPNTGLTTPISNLRNLSNLVLVAAVVSQGSEFKAEIVSGLPHPQDCLLAYGPSAGDARKNLLAELKLRNMTGSIRFQAVREEYEPERQYQSASTLNAAPALATEKQVAYAVSLSAQIGDLSEVSQAALSKIYAKQTKAEISKTIDDLRTHKDKLHAEGKLPAQIARKAAASSAKTPSAEVKLEDGMYKLDDLILKVVHAVHGSGHQYAKVLTSVGGGKYKFVHRKGIIRKLTPEMKLSKEDAKAFGVLYGTCCICGRTLTDEVSIENGIGPVCADKMGW